MSASRIVNIDSIGPVLFERSRRARRVIISVHQDRGVRVAVPDRVPYEQAIDFVMRKQPWVQKHLARIQREQRRRRALEASFARIDPAAASRRIKERLRYLAGRYGFSYNRVSIRNQKTRWGSCSGDDNISLNIKLVRLSAPLMDYVILHELVHTRFHDHSPRFWAELDKYVGDARALSRRVRQSGIDLL
jgi:predicted metal-dependent hydrolase